MYARRTALSMTSAIVKTVTGLLVKARDSVDERGLDVLNAAPIITKLMPNILASISSLAVVDPASAVQVRKSNFILICQTQSSLDSNE
jgi:hypothetical protein